MIGCPKKQIRKKNPHTTWANKTTCPFFLRTMHARTSRPTSLIFFLKKIYYLTLIFISVFLYNFIIQYLINFELIFIIYFYFIFMRLSQSQTNVLTFSCCSILRTYIFIIILLNKKYYS
jgi:hypothetical protein